VGVPQRIFTVDEANAALPRLVHFVTELQRLARRLEDERRAAARTLGCTPDMLRQTDVVRVRPAARLVIEELDAVVAEIEEAGAQLKDVRLGLVDFPGVVGGRRVLLCWQLGEPEIAFYHDEREGFTGRRRLPGADPGRWLQ
jgi:hypothetical protein